MAYTEKFSVVPNSLSSGVSKIDGFGLGFFCSPQCL